MMYYYLLCIYYICCKQCGIFRKKIITTTDIYKDDLVEKVKKADKEAKEYYAKLDKEKLEQEKEVDEK